MRRRITRALGVVLALLLVVLAGACGDDDNSNTSGSGATTAPEDVRAPAAEVTAGLRRIETLAKDIAAAAATDKSRAQELAGQIEPIWQKVEGTVKANSQDLYLKFEDAFAALENAASNGDAVKADTAANSVSSAVHEYLAKYPG